MATIQKGPKETAHIAECDPCQKSLTCKPRRMIIKSEMGWEKKQAATAPAISRPWALCTDCGDDGFRDSAGYELCWECRHLRQGR